LWPWCRRNKFGGADWMNYPIWTPPVSI